MAGLRSSRTAYRLRGTKPEPDALRRNAATQRAILAAAARLVRRDGYNRVTIEAIAAEAGAGKQTIYRWWKSKPALFADVLGEPAARGPGRGTPAARLAQVLGDLARETTAPLQARIRLGLLAEAAADSKFAAVVQARLIGPQTARVQAVLAQARRAGRLRRNADIKMAADQLVAALWFHGMVGGKRIDGRFTGRLVAQTLRGLAA